MEKPWINKTVLTERFHMEANGSLVSDSTKFCWPIHQPGPTRLVMDLGLCRLSSGLMPLQVTARCLAIEHEL